MARMTKTKIKIKHRYTGGILFEYEKENNSIRDTLIEAVKNKADINFANLMGADLSGADLRYVDLIGADLHGADLSRVNLHRAVLMDADISFTDLRRADLQNADLRRADLHNADLRGADLRGVDLHNADICNARLYGTKNVPHIPLACPSEGAFIGWKKVHTCLVKLEIPEDARRCSATTNKCRCDKAKVLSITDLDGENPITEIKNTNYALLTYKVGEMVYPDSFDEDRWNECSHGIHFFVNKRDAIDY